MIAKGYLFVFKPSFPEDSTVLEGTEVLKVAGMFALPIMVAVVQNLGVFHHFGYLSYSVF